MNTKIKKILANTKGLKIGLFIDNANWFYPQKELGWRISFSRLYKFLKKNYKISFIKIYAGTPLDINDRQKFISFCEKVEKIGFSITTKPLKKIWIAQDKKLFVYKCNFDVEIALDVARNINQLDVVIIGNGDSDFLEICNFAQDHKKKFIVLCFEKGIAWEMRKKHHILLEDIKEQIVHKKSPNLAVGVSITKRSIAKRK